MKEVSEIVQKILLKDVKSRDCDMRLWFKCLKMDTNILEVISRHQLDLMEKILVSSPMKPQTVIRARRFAQQRLPETRGDKYDERQTKAFNPCKFLKRTI